MEFGDSPNSSRRKIDAVTVNPGPGEVTVYNTLSTLYPDHAADQGKAGTCNLRAWATLAVGQSFDFCTRVQTEPTCMILHLRTVIYML